MRTPPLTRLAEFLSSPEVVTDSAALAEGWQDHDATFVLGGIGQRVKADFGAHLRRSFLGALGASASAPARARLPCTWEPPCAFDVFAREQLRDDSGNGLPKPYVFQFRPHGDDLIVTLRVFGVANDWFVAAAEALVAGLANLPWSREFPGMSSPPPILDRRFSSQAIAPAAPSGAVRLYFMSPADIAGEAEGQARDLGARLMSLLINRAVALSRWNGIILEPDCKRQLTHAAAGIVSNIGGISKHRHLSPNRRHEQRDDPVISGFIDLAGDFSELGPILQIGQRCNLGRKANEGLGAFALDSPSEIS